MGLQREFFPFPRGTFASGIAEMRQIEGRILFGAVFLTFPVREVGNLCMLPLTPHLCLLFLASPPKAGICVYLLLLMDVLGDLHKTCEI